MKGGREPRDIVQCQLWLTLPVSLASFSSCCDYVAVGVSLLVE